ncbi:MAG: Ferredoxin thioredoxin reductase catalytic beta chain [Methanoregulaceae archaeon PtaB.Bin056]|jgi:ferredoxin-thioredoxin reductase catalytic subunit|nr:MAG: Ferredoxin thioredoxin reductase catalytic beta chain [Methanoregulaceae archaeon PtaB.Bin056]
MTAEGIPDETVSVRMEEIRKAAEDGGYILNPDPDFVRSLVAGICVNEQRYGYAACPCRLASGNREEDLDIICPCDYRDPDLNDFGACYCALYVSAGVAAGTVQAPCVPERRPARQQRKKARESSATIAGKVSMPVWRCRVCGYLCARENPPLVCPICKASQDRFVRFM